MNSEYIVSKDARIISDTLNTCDIIFDERSIFFGALSGCFNMRSLIGQRYEGNTKLHQDAANTYSCTGEEDFGHTAPCWDDIITLGLVGLKKRVEAYAKRNQDERALLFYQAVIQVYEAAQAFALRAAQKAEACRKFQIAVGLRHLSHSAPGNLYEAMQMIFLYYNLQQNVEGTNLRTLGRLDKYLMPFYEKEKDKEAAGKLILDFVAELDWLKAVSNIPFALGGADLSGNDMTNEMSYLILDAYTKQKCSNTKIHILYHEKMPERFVEQALDSIRKGFNSIIFMSDDMIRKSLVKLGECEADAADYFIVGCYECGGREEITASCNARVSIPKAVEFALNNGIDVLTGQKIGLGVEKMPESYDELYEEVIRQLKHLVLMAMEATDAREAMYPKIHSAPFFSATYLSALEKGGDVYCDYAAKYENSSLNALGLATAVDSLAAIRKLVFEDRVMTLNEFTKLLKNNWKDHEGLRLVIKNAYPKYGNGNFEVDRIAADLVSRLSDMVNNVPNAKGGVYRLGTFSIDWRLVFGRCMSASADGRLSGEPISQNATAVFGADKEGITAHILSVTEIDTTNTANGTVLDMDIHSSAVKGRNGLLVMKATLTTFMERGGFGIHYNVLDCEVLRDAQVNPHKYPNLQVRLCGWNVLFSTLSKQAQDEFIFRAENSQ